MFNPKIYYIINKDKINSQRRENYKANPEKTLTKNRIWRSKNKDKIHQYMKKYNSIYCKSPKRKMYIKIWKEKNKELFKSYTRKSYLKHREIYLRNRKIRSQDLKKKVVSFYSNNSMCCKNCGFSDIRALQLDHINGGGVKHAKIVGGNGTRMYRWIIKNNFPSLFQVLCANCNWIKRHENNECRKKSI